MNASSYNRRAVGWIVSSIVMVFLLSVACGATKGAVAPRGSGGVTNLPVPTTVVGYAPATATPTPVADGITSGTYEVGTDMKPGKYKTAGPDPDDYIPNCYWARLKHNDGKVGDIIDNDNLDGQGVVTVRAGEYFKTSGCQPWRAA